MLSQDNLETVRAVTITALGRVGVQAKSSWKARSIGVKGKRKKKQKKTHTMNHTSLSFIFFLSVVSSIVFLVELSVSQD